jgi:hypothetical protein
MIKKPYNDNKTAVMIKPAPMMTKHPWIMINSPESSRVQRLFFSILISSAVLLGWAYT